MPKMAAAFLCWPCFLSGRRWNRERMRQSTPTHARDWPGVLPHCRKMKRAILSCANVPERVTDTFRLEGNLPSLLYDLKLLE